MMGDRKAAPIALNAGSRRGILLLHGFGDTPQTFCYLAPALHAAGFSVRVPLLPGHGTTVADFHRSGVEAWLDSSRREFQRLQRDVEVAGLGGLSMGGALATLLAADLPELPALVLLAPYLGMPPLLRATSRLHRLWGRLAGEFGQTSHDSIRDPVEYERNLGYGRTTARALNELREAAYRARRVLPRVNAPTLIMQSVLDNRVSRRIAEDAYRRLGSADKRLVFSEQGGHVLTVDYGHKEVARTVVDWYEDHMR